MKLAIFFSCVLLNRDFACAKMVHTQEYQPVAELLLKLSDSLHKQYKYIKYVHEELSIQKKKKLATRLLILYGFCI